MKTLNKLAVAGLCVAVLASCDDLDTTYQGKYVTSEQKTETLKLQPDLAQAGVNGIPAIFSSYMTVYGNHFDFGYPAIMIGLDLQGEDYQVLHSGYNWYRYWQGFTYPAPGGTPAGMAWYHIYKQILNCNTVAAGIPKDAEDAQLKFYRAQAVGARAFDYLVLAQLFQFNYVLDPTAPGVPVITDENSEEAAINGAPRATLTEQYEQIMEDITEAISLLSSTSYTPEKAMSVKPRRLISLATAYGIRARANMAMHKYAEAAADAQSAIDNFSGRPYTIEELSTPGFTSLDDPAWMWGIAIAETDRVVTSGIVNFPSMVCSFVDGYTSVGAWKYASDVCYNSIGLADVRKGWFLDENGKSTHLSATQQAYLDSFDDLPAYTNVKFGSYDGTCGGSLNASDIPLMRIEEMYNIRSEAKALAGQATAAKDEYEAFVKAYRNPNYRISGTTAKEIADAIWADKRIELWGEGLIYFDFMRRDMPVDRTKLTNVSPNFKFYIPSYSEDPGDGYKQKTKAGVLIYCLPEGEINGNKAISESDNNLTCTAPEP